jgi:hypothetical protein
MKHILSVLIACIVAIATGCATSNRHPGEITTPTVVSAACGQCQFHLKGKKGCDLAVTIDGKSYFVDGFTMKQFGNAHGENGMCKTVRHAKVTGHVENGRFAATSFELLPVQQ